MPFLGIAAKAALGFLSGLPRWAYEALAAIALLGLAWALHGGWEHAAYNRAFNAGWSALAKRDAAALVAAQKRNEKATATSTTERTADTAKITATHEEQTHAIDTAAPGATGAATRRLGCVRYAQQHPGAGRPAGC